MDKNIYSALAKSFPQDRKKTAIEVIDAPDCGKLKYSWQDVDRITAMFANFLLGLGIPDDARIVVYVEKSVEAFFFYLAVARGGWTFVPLNNSYKSQEVEYFINDARPAVVVCSEKNREWITRISNAVGVAHVLTLNEDGSGSLVHHAGECVDDHVAVVCDKDRLAAIIYTSGTTGRSKGAMLTHGNLLSNASTLTDYWGWGGGRDVLIHCLPIYHVHGLFVASHCAFLSGSSMLWVNKFDARLIIDLLPRATVFMGVPTLYTRMLAENSLTREQCASMRLFISGSAPLLAETHDAFRERTGHSILERYGMSETLMLTSNPYREEDGRRLAGTVGYPLPGVQMRIVDDHGNVCTTDEPGHVQVKGDNVFKGYWGLPEKTAEEFSFDGWFKTGDLGKVDAAGVVTLVGRSKDLIITGGFNVYPVEGESVINSLPGVSESAVIAVPHADFGEGVVAVVVLEPGSLLNEQSLLAQLKERLAAFKVPKGAEFLPDLPRNAMGKVQKAVLRQQFAGWFTDCRPGD